MPIQMLPIDALSRTTSLQIRDSLHPDVIDDYADVVRGGETMPPVVVFLENDRGKITYWLADGFHRVAAHEAALITRISCDVRKGTRRDAIEFALRANTQHGLRLTTAEKRRAVSLCFADPEWQNRSIHWIAKMCGVTEHIVRSVYSELPEETKAAMSANVIGMDGKYRPRFMPVADEKSASDDDVELFIAPPPAPSIAEHAQQEVHPPQPSAGGPEQRDVNGRIIPPHIVPVFGTLGKELTAARTMLRDVENKLLQLYDSPWGPHLNTILRQVLRNGTLHRECGAIRDLLYMLRKLTPYCICPLCEGRGSGCEVQDAETGIVSAPCRGSGFLLADDWERVQRLDNVQKQVVEL